MTTPKLMAASKDDDAETVTQLLAQGLSPDAANGIGQTSLHVASIWGNLAVARVLLDAGASVNVVNQFGATPLHFAAQNSRLDPQQGVGWLGGAVCKVRTGGSHRRAGPIRYR